MLNQLGQAIEANEYIVITGWTPHWMFAEWQLKFLEDPMGVYGEAERIEAYASKRLSEDYIEVGNFLSNYTFETDEIASLMDYFKNAESGADLKEVSREWILANTNLVDSWL
jgi:glycine betaine/proline transport system substrate-binding protein